MKRTTSLCKWLASAAVALTASIAMSLTAAATDENDVIAALRDVGLPEYLVQECVNYYRTTATKNGKTYTSEDFDNVVDLVYVYQDTIEAELSSFFGVDISQGSSTAPTTGTTPSSQTTQTTVVSGQSPTTGTSTKPSFLNMTIAEKRAYVLSLPEAERANFLANLSDAERNSIIKELSTEQKTEILNKLVSMGQGIGLNVTVNDVDNNSVSVSIRDQDGNLVDSSSVGVIVNDTGWNRTLPVSIAVGMLLLALGGMVCMLRIAKREPTADAEDSRHA